MTTPLDLSGVTLCAATSVNLAATVAALARCLAQARFAETILFTDAPCPDLPPGISIHPVAPMRSLADYSRVILEVLPGAIASRHCLVVQWDGFIVDPDAWCDEFLDCDYIGAPWPQFGDGHDVGNGGFSLRSKLLLQACRDPRFVPHAVEDLAIGRLNRRLLEDEFGLRFADRALAGHFSFERDRPLSGRFAFERHRPRPRTFGFHGAFNLLDIVGVEDFWRIYRSLDSRQGLRRDFPALLGRIIPGRLGPLRAARMLRHFLLD